MGSLTIKQKVLRCEKCFQLKKFIIEPNYPNSTILSKCACGFYRQNILDFTKNIKEEEIYIIKCNFCKKEPKHPLYCNGCKRIYCNTCKIGHDTELKTKNEHILIDVYKYDFYCILHQDEFNSGYCLNCEMDICGLCITEKKHSGHICLTYNKLELNKIEEEIFLKNMKISEKKIVKKINISKCLLKQINNKEKKKEFKTLVNSTLRDNKSILALVQYFYQIYSENKHKTYNIIYNFKENIKFNHQPLLFTENAPSFQQKYDDFVEYLKSDFVLFKRYVSTKINNQIIILSKKKENQENNINNNNNEEIIKVRRSMNDTYNDSSNYIDATFNPIKKINDDNNNNIEINDNDKIIANVVELSNEEYKVNNDDNKINNINENDKKNENIKCINSQNNIYNKRKSKPIFDLNEIINEKYEDEDIFEDEEDINIHINGEEISFNDINNNIILTKGDISEINSKTENEIKVFNDIINNHNITNKAFNDDNNNVINEENINEGKESDNDNINNEEENKKKEKLDNDNNILSGIQEKNNSINDDNDINIFDNNNTNHNINNNQIIINEEQDENFKEKEIKDEENNIVIINENDDYNIKQEKIIENALNLDNKKDIIKDIKKEDIQKELNKEKKEEIKNQNNNLRSSKTILEKINELNNNIKSKKNTESKQEVKKVYNPNILKIPKFANLANTMKNKINHGENTKKETRNENIRIISEKKNPNLLIMNKPTLSKMTIKRKPKKITFN